MRKVPTMPQILLLVLLLTGLVREGSAQTPAGLAENRQVALVTGSTDGLGRELALRIGGMGMHVIVHGRNAERGAAVVKEIVDAGGSASFIRADLASLDQVRELAATVLRDHDRLDLLVNNAGIGRGADETLREVSQDGHELRLAVNYLSHFLLSRTLLPLLIETGNSRIVSVSSSAQAQGQIDFSDVMLERGEYQGQRAYAQSKLAQIFMTIDLAEELQGTGVTVNAVHPAVFMATTMVLSRGGTPMATIDEGADPVMLVATHPNAGTGQYYNQSRPARAHAQAYDAEARRQLRELAMKLTGLE
jgi:NAD(P)-dependent dehydrogenase (short-subunit alcohol dehydrogenase family)